MKTLIKVILTLTIAGCLSACKKTAVPPASIVASLSFVNATVGSSPVVVRIGNPNTIYSTLASTNKLSYGTSNVFSPVSGNTSIALVQSTDTLNTLFIGTLNLQNANVYSLYLTGTIAQPDTVFIHENLPVIAKTDSIAGIRFVNLSTASGPVSVDIKGQANGSEVQSLAYKSYTAFKRYVADHTVASYVFEFRNVSTGTLLATYTLSGVNTNSTTVANTVRFHNQTIALIGGGTAATSAIYVANY